MSTILFFGLIMLGACSDVEEEGTPLSVPAKFKVESNEYYVQITNENIDGVAFVYRWINMDGASYVLSMTNAASAGTDETETKSVQIADTSILTYNNVRELEFTNRQILEYAQTLGILPQQGNETVANLILTFSAVNAAGEVIVQDDVEATSTATINVVLSRDLSLDGLTD